MCPDCGWDAVVGVRVAADADCVGGWWVGVGFGDVRDALVEGTVGATELDGRRLVGTLGVRLVGRRKVDGDEAAGTDTSGEDAPPPELHPVSRRAARPVANTRRTAPQSHNPPVRLGSPGVRSTAWRRVVGSTVVKGSAAVAASRTCSN